MKRIVGVAITLVLVAGLAFVYRTEIALEAVGVMSRLRMPVGPHQVVDSSTNAAPVSRDDRPNIIIEINEKGKVVGNYLRNISEIAR